MQTSRKSIELVLKLHARTFTHSYIYIYGAQAYTHTHTHRYHPAIDRSAPTQCARKRPNRFLSAGYWYIVSLQNDTKHITVAHHRSLIETVTHFSTMQYHRPETFVQSSRRIINKMPSSFVQPWIKIWVFRIYVLHVSYARLARFLASKREPTDCVLSIVQNIEAGIERIWICWNAFFNEPKPHIIKSA